MPLTSTPTEPDFRQLFECLPGLYLVLRPDLTVVAASDAYLAAAKRMRHRILGRPFLDAFPAAPDSAHAELSAVLQARQPAESAAPELEPGPPPGHWRAVNHPLPGPSGEVDYILRHVFDSVTAAEQERDVFFLHSFDLMCVVGTDGYFKRVNPAFGRVLGYTEQELLAVPLANFLHPDDVARTKSRIETLASGTPTLSSVNRYRCKSGEYRTFSWNTKPVGPLLYSVGHDITEQVRAEERVRDLNAGLERKNQGLEKLVEDRMADLRRTEGQMQQLQKMDAIGRLAGGIAHDFNNLLGSIAMYCDLLADDAGNPEVVANLAEEIRRVTERGAALTRQLLVFSRKQIAQLQPVNVNPLIQQMEKMLRRLIGENMRIVTKFAEGVPHVKADPSQLEQVVLNLVVNARDAMPKGGAITIETSRQPLPQRGIHEHPPFREPGPLRAPHRNRRRHRHGRRHTEPAL